MVEGRRGIQPNIMYKMGQGIKTVICDLSGNLNQTFLMTTLKQSFSWCISSVACFICFPDFHLKALKFQCTKNKISLSML